MLTESEGRPTRVGLLQLDSLDEPHRSIAGDYDQLFANVVHQVSADIELVTFDGRAELPGHEVCDGWIIPGSRESVYDGTPWIHELERWTVEALDRHVPLVGICFGHQLIAQALGVTVSKAPVGWNIGAIDYEIHSQPAGVAAVPDRFRLIASHQDQVQHLPTGATLFASSDGCPIAGYTIDDNVLCVQAHPEFAPDLAASLYRARVDRIGDDAVNVAISTLDRPLDRPLAAAWLTDTVQSQISFKAAVA